MTIEDSTIAGNTASMGGGGIYDNAGINQLLTVEGSTISSNTTGGGPSGIQGADMTPVVLAATILATPGGPPAGGECAGPAITDDGYNVDDDGTCGLSAPGSVSASAAIDDYLGSDAGPYVALLASPSPSTNAADPALAAIPGSFRLPDSTLACARPDQRGLARQAPWIWVPSSSARRR